MLVDAISAGARAISFIAIFQAVGFAMFLAILAGPLADHTRAALRQTLVRSAWVAISFTLLHYLVEAGRMGGSLAAVADVSLQKMVLQSPAANALGLRILGLLFIGISTLLPRTIAAIVALTGAALTLFAFTRTGHTSLEDTQPILPFLLLFHLVIIAFWFGALVPLRRISLDEPPSVTAAVVGRFSAIAVWIVPIVFVSGVCMAALLLGSLRALATSYGLVVLTKAALFGSLMFMAALNKWRYGPALGRGESAAGHGFRRTVATEYGVISAILALTAALTTFLSPDSA
jgi:copper resistance protein D